MLLYDRFLDSLKLIDTHCDQPALNLAPEVLDHGSFNSGPLSARTPRPAKARGAETVLASAMDAIGEDAEEEEAKDAVYA